MHASKSSIRAGALISFALLAWVLSHYVDFQGEEYGMQMFWASVCCAAAVWPCIACRWDSPKWVRGAVLVAVFFFVPYIMVILVERLNGKFISEFLLGEEDLQANYVIALLLYILAFALSGSFRISMLTVSPALLFFGIVNMYLKEFKGSPFMPMDIRSIKTAANVAGGYTYDIGYEMVLGISATACIMAFASRIKMSRWKLPAKLIVRGACAVAVVGACYTFYFTDTVADAGLKPDFFNQTRGYNHHGAILEFTLNTKYLTLPVPDGYDVDDLENIVEDTISDGTPNILETALVRQGSTEEEAAEAVNVETAGEQGITPNVIVIMNESFSDLSVVGDFETNQDYMPFIHSLNGAENTIEGNAYVSTIGTGTSNTEFEFLTGDTMAFLPHGSNAYQLYEKDIQPGLVSTLLAQRYTADAFHPYYASSWNRVDVYKLLGFRSFTTLEDMVDADILDDYKSSGYSYTLYKRLLSQRYPGENIILRRFVSDAYDFKKVEEMYENKEEGTPMFLFNVTMQNHSSYNQKFDNFTQEIKLTSTEGSYPKTEQYLSLVKKTDEAFEDLINYFSEVDEPTIILMFGDHQPYIEDSFYTEVMGESVDDMDDEKQQLRYITRFVLWANYDIPEGWIDEISMNYLSTLLLQTAGLDMPDYNRYLACLYAEYPVITAMGCRDADGNFFEVDATSALSGDIADYRCVAYNNLAGGKNRVSSIFFLPGGEDALKASAAQNTKEEE